MFVIILNSHAYVNNKTIVTVIKEIYSLGEAFNPARYCSVITHHQNKF